MYVANIQQLYEKKPDGKKISNWVVLVCLKAGTRIEKVVRDKHESNESNLREHNVAYAEITTSQGKNYLYDMFNCSQKKHPFFLVFNKYPPKCTKEDHCMMVEWGKWKDIEKLKNDLTAFVTFFSDKDFRKKIKNAQNKKLWKSILKYVEPIIKTGISILKVVI